MNDHEHSEHEHEQHEHDLQEHELLHERGQHAKKIMTVTNFVIISSCMPIFQILLTSN
jgi:hypothetical protein